MHILSMREMKRISDSWSFSFTGLFPLALLSYFPVLIYFPWLTAQVEEMLKFDRFLSPHYRYFTREMRIIAYTQLLESYRSLTLDYMANAFGVTTEFVDQWVLIGLDVRENCIHLYQSEQDWKFFLCWCCVLTLPVSWIWFHVYCMSALYYIIGYVQI